MSMGTYTRISDGATVSGSEALDARGLLRDGYILRFSTCLVDSAPAKPTLLRDAAGAPIVLLDAATGSTLKLTDSLIAAIDSEAAKAGLPVDRYVADVLRYQPITAR